MRMGLFPRTVGGCVLYLLVMGGVAAVVFAANAEQRRADRLSAQAAQLHTAVEQAEDQLFDLDRTERAYLVTHETALLGVWSAQRATLDGRIAGLRRQVHDPRQAKRAGDLSQDSQSYERDHALPALQAAQAGRPAGSVALRDGDRRVAGLRGELEGFAAADEQMAALHERRARMLTRTAGGAMAIGLLASALVGVFFVLYLNKTVVRPVRRAAAMAGQLAHGELTARIPETGAGEVGRLTRSFNVMGRSMQRSVAELVSYGRTQAALRRIAVRIAQGAGPHEALDAVVTELGRLVGTDGAHIVRFEDGEGSVVAAWGEAEVRMPVGTRVPLDSESVSARVRRTGRAARMDSYEHAAGPLAAGLREHDVRAAIGAPIVVEGRLWGVVTATVVGDEPLADEAGERLVDYTDLIATTVANAQARSDLATSRARVVMAADQARRQIERNLHDGIQQHLFAIAMGMRAAEEGVPPDLPHVRHRIATATDHLGTVLDDLREISRGIHPAILTERGLAPALKTLARRCALPVELDLHLDRRLPEEVEVAAYYIAAEALTNATKHAQASLVRLEATIDDGELHLSVCDDGAGGADATRGSGLIGLVDRVHALGGSVAVTSPSGGGTRVDAELPLDFVAAAAASARPG